MGLCCAATCFVSLLLDVMFDRGDRFFVCGLAFVGL